MYSVTPETGCHWIKSLDTARLFKTTICSDPCKLLGEGLRSVNTDIVLVDKVEPSSTLAYFDGL